jgi:drug/metabolite transporter (DMT)-like permease
VTRPAIGIPILAALWGGSYLLVHIALRDLGPWMVVWGRVLCGLAVVAPLAHATGALTGLRAHARPLMITGILQITLPVAFIAIGQQWIPSSLAGVLNGSVPIFVAVLAPFVDHGERATPRRAVGIAIGFAGVVAVYGLDVGTSTKAILGAVSLTLSSVFYALGPLYGRSRLGGLKPLGIVTGLLLTASVASLVPALLEWPDHVPSLGSLGALVLLGAGATGAGFVLYYGVMLKIGPGRTSIVAYLIPGFAVFYGAVLLDEHIGPGIAIGLVLILIGSFIVSRSPARITQVAPPVEPAT